MKRWESQLTSLAQVRGLIESGEQRICLTAPTGGGKSLCIFDMCRWGFPTIIYVNRTILAEQFFEGMAQHGIDFGALKSGYAEEISKEIQVASVPTVHARWKKGEMALFPAKLVIVDEIHNEKSLRMLELLNAHLEMGAIAYVVVTATPLGIAHLADKIVIAGATSDLRRSGALVPAKTYAPDEPALKAFKNERAGIMQMRDDAKKSILPVMFGRVVEHWKRLNPEGRPTILFAEGVPESQWFAEHLFRSGIPAGHIDAKRVWINGESFQANRESRKALRAASESGEVQIVCNRFVLREGVDWPHLYHGIFTCKVGSLATYIQMGGRLLRQHFINGVPQLEHVICIARDTLVLTDRGQVPIQDVKLEDRLWDGVEFVKHGGAVCKGRRRVITWDGLTATPDHKVHTTDGWETISTAARYQRRITRSGAGWVPIRLFDYSDPYNSICRREAGGPSRLRSVWGPIIRALSQVGKKAGSRVSQLYASLRRSLPGMDLPSRAASVEALQRFEGCWLSPVWWTGNPVSLPVDLGRHALDRRQSRRSRRSEADNRSHQQRWPLRGWQFAVGHSVGADAKSREDHEARLSLQAISAAISTRWLYAVLFGHTFREGPDGGTDRGEVGHTCEVWDILDAGPRHRFTAANLLVANCQDHGGNYWRHDSINCDREWSLEKTERQLTAERAERYRTKADSEPIVCSKCKKVRKYGVTCPDCGYTAKQRSRMVIQTNGQLREVYGDIYHPRRTTEQPSLHKAWTTCVFRCRNAGRTMTQARALFQRENNGLSPGEGFPFMPKRASDWYLPVETLFPKKQKTHV